jgi:rhamnulokinase
MPARIAAACRSTGQPIPTPPREIVRCILDRRATTFAPRIEDAQRLSGRRIDIIHIVGGGARNTLLCQLIADAAGRPVVAGPVESTALGNILVQARTHGILRGDRWELRRHLRSTVSTRTYRPQAAGADLTVARLG